MESGQSLYHDLYIVEREVSRYRDNFEGTDMFQKDPDGIIMWQCVAGVKQSPTDIRHHSGMTHLRKCCCTIP